MDDSFVESLLDEIQKLSNEISMLKQRNEELQE